MTIAQKKSFTGINFTEKELDAMYEKEMTPSKNVTCPRCGRLLVYKDFGSAYTVECPTEGCIRKTVRGI